jgi:hypothetical protein
MGRWHGKGRPMSTGRTVHLVISAVLCGLAGPLLVLGHVALALVFLGLYVAQLAWLGYGCTTGAVERHLYRQQRQRQKRELRTPRPRRSAS